MSKKGYALMEYGGNYEDSWENIVKIYFSEEKAEKIKKIMEEQLAKKEEKYDKCVDCMSEYEPYLIENLGEFKVFKEKISKICDRANFVWREDKEYKAQCKNKFDILSMDMFEPCGYRIAEVKVDIGEA